MIFLGAGASTIYGLKTLRGLTKDLVQRMIVADHEDIIDDIKAGLIRFGRVPDFENIYTVIEALVNPKQGVKESGPFATYIAHTCKGFGKIRSRPGFRSILEDFRRIIFEECTISPEKIAAKRHLYDEFFKISSAGSENRILSSIIGGSGNVTSVPPSRTIVTTNYDMSMELHHANAEQPLADGFSIKGEPYIRKFDASSYVALGSNSQWLIKLHGSIWQFQYKKQFCKALLDPEILPHRRLKIKERMMIYPVGEKPILQEPYYTFYRIFKEQPWLVMVAIGHSFRDLPINVAILENLERTPGSRLIVINKKPGKVVKNLNVKNLELDKRIIRVRGRFGEAKTLEKLKIAMISRNFNNYRSIISRKKLE